MTFSLGTIALIFIGYIMVYSIVNRVCQCVEHCALSKAFAAYLTKGGKVNGFNMVAEAVARATERYNKTGEKDTNE